MAVVPFPARNKLAYPAGTRAGIDPRHPASTGLVLSAVVGGGPNYMNLSTGAPLGNNSGTQLTAPTASIQGAVGPSISSLTGGKALGIATSKTYNFLTMAGIFRYSSSTVAGYQSVIVFDANLGIFITGNAVNAYFNADHSGATLSFDTPYFVAISSVLVSGSVINVVVKNLSTGQIVTATPTHGQNGYVNPKVSVGTDTGNEFSNFPIAAAMFSETALSMSQLQQWADDPWAFWYPPQQRSRIAAAAATFLAGWAQQTNLPVLGTGTY